MQTANFWSKVNKTNICWNWLGYRNKAGYGRFHVPGTKSAAISAHKFAYVEVIGIVPKGLELHHKCGNKGCVRPDHLEIVTRKDHPDAAPSIQRSKTHCPSGHAYTPENTWIHPIEKSRHCRTCNRNNSNRIRLAKLA